MRLTFDVNDKVEDDERMVEEEEVFGVALPPASSNASWLSILKFDDDDEEDGKEGKAEDGDEGKEKEEINDEACWMALPLACSNAFHRSCLTVFEYACFCR